MHQHWEMKRKRSSNMSNGDINRWYEVGRDAGAIGGKMVGAGGGGFLLFYTRIARACGPQWPRKADGSALPLRPRRVDHHHARLASRPRCKV